VNALTRLSSAEARGLRGILFDLDDTFLTHGVLTRAAYDALWALRNGGLVLVVVTGRPSGWGAVLARQWPIDGCVTENGAIHVLREKAGITYRDTCDATERAARRARLVRLVEGVRVLVPEARLADDNSERCSDVTWDIGERERLAGDRIRKIVSAIDAAGARHTQSSVHLHATFDSDDKASGALRFCVAELGEEPAAALGRFAFVGDSGNDAPCFGAFRTTFGVSNVIGHLRRITTAPRFVATRPMGDGFAEIADEILSKRLP